ncbi:hypothetical protein Phi48:2_gp19 [Cellulophaga phage phi48:2]|uniref:hypothetical protein n=1 Tax=Cellulophaga phage phi48:2 TaxID=1327968 RepID=UPI00035171DF|nr:hypothetical protein Phi48:2_gp19 [Cellulophaga phage phi48:2]AGO47267.1 hypothetical protein Phi48:2_gp19 [Cellulophaga phage phi48:2]
MNEILKNVTANVLSYIIIGMLAIFGWLIFDFKEALAVRTVQYENMIFRVNSNTTRLDLRSDFILTTSTRLKALETTQNNIVRIIEKQH